MWKTLNWLSMGEVGHGWAAAGGGGSCFAVLPVFGSSEVQKGKKEFGFLKNPGLPIRCPNGSPSLDMGQWVSSRIGYIYISLSVYTIYLLTHFPMKGGLSGTQTKLKQPNGSEIFTSHRPHLIHLIAPTLTLGYISSPPPSPWGNYLNVLWPPSIPLSQYRPLTSLVGTSAGCHTNS